MTVEPAVVDEHRVPSEFILGESFGAGNSDTSPLQLQLPTFAGPDRRAASSPTAPSNRRNAIKVDDDPLCVLYLRRPRARRHAPAGAKAYKYQLDATLKIAARTCTSQIDLLELMRDISLLGQVLVDDVAPLKPGIVSKWTLAQRPSAVRSFASLMSPELRSLIGDDPLLRIDASLRLMAERVGTGYRLAGGRPRNRSGYVPTADEINAVLRAAGQDSGFRGIRNTVFLDISSRLERGSTLVDLLTGLIAS